MLVWPFDIIYAQKSQLWTSKGQLQAPLFTPKAGFSFFFKVFLLSWHFLPSDCITASFLYYSLKISAICCFFPRIHFCHPCMFFSSMYIFGGFSGLLLNDVLAYTPPSCLAFSNQNSCTAAGPGLRCQWVTGRCVPWESKPPGHIFKPPFCPVRPGTLIVGPVWLIESYQMSLYVTDSASH